MDSDWNEVRRQAIIQWCRSAEPPECYMCVAEYLANTHMTPTEKATYQADCWTRRIAYIAQLRKTWELCYPGRIK